MAESYAWDPLPPTNPEHNPEDNNRAFPDTLSDENLKRLAEKVAGFQANSNKDAASGGKFD